MRSDKLPKETGGENTLPTSHTSRRDLPAAESTPPTLAREAPRFNIYSIMNSAAHIQKAATVSAKRSLTICKPVDTPTGYADSELGLSSVFGYVHFYLRHGKPIAAAITTM